MTDIMGFLALHIMSDTPSQQTELRPDESVSQINFDDDIPKANEGLYSDVGNETLSARVLSGGGSSFTTSSQSAYFIVTEATLHEAQVFLKVLYYCPKILNLSHRILVSNSNFKEEAPIPNIGSITMSVSITPLVSHIACASIVVKPWCILADSRVNQLRLSYVIIQNVMPIYDFNVGSEATLSGFFDNNQQAQLQQTVTKAMIEEEVLKYIISGNIPFTQVENEHFRKLISWIQVNNRPVTAPSRKVIRSRLSVQSELAKENLKNVLKANSSKISLALDFWSTRTSYGFLGTLFMWYSITSSDISSHYRPLDRRGLESPWGPIGF